MGDSADHEPWTASRSPPDPPEARPPGAPGHQPGEHIGHYRLLSTLGEGGFGVVYLAEQAEPVRRRVALKVIKPGMDSAAVVARFEQERQALAVMDHPNVARVLDAGATERGLPYFVMEYVKGEPVTAYCDRHNLTIRQRLELFIPVCEAVQHAHMKGIIHRDIKPSNVLVAVGDGGPVVKVIDFGVAKALSHTLTQKTIFTEHGQLIGTPEYMSPEQAEMGATDIDTRTDVYSLGVLLYELLTGATPFDSKSLRRAGLGEIQRIIREVDPPKPSTRLSSLGEKSAEIAKHRRMKREELSRELARELDWIPLKAMRKDRTERYRTATDLADDIRNYLEGRPLEAGPESAAYRLRKFVRRNKKPVAAVAAVILVLIAGIIGTTLGMQRALIAEAVAEEEARRALAAEAETERRAAELEQVVEFQSAQLSEIDAPLMGIRLRQSILDKRRATLEAINADGAAVAAALTLLESSLAGVNFTNVALEALEENIFERALTAINDRFTDQPLVKATLLQTIASTLDELGLAHHALAPQAEALETRRQYLGNEHPDTLASIGNMGALLITLGKPDESEPYIREALGTSRRTLGDEHPLTAVSMNNMGYMLKSLGKLAEAEPFYRDALEISRRILGDEHQDTLIQTSNLGGLLTAQRRYAEAERYHREALETSRRVLGETHPRTITLNNNLGALFWQQDRHAEAEPYYREALETSRRVLGDEHPLTLTAVNNMGALLYSQGRLSEAEPFYREALDTLRRVLGDEHRSTLIAINNLGALLDEQGRYAEAEPFYREAMEALLRVLGEDHQLTLTAMNNMGALLYSQGKFAEAEPYWREALETSRRVLGDEDQDTLASMSSMGTLLRELGRLDEAEKLGAEAVETARRTLTAAHWHTAVFLVRHALTLTAMQRFAEAEPLALEAHDIFAAALGPDHQRTIAAARQLTDLYDAWHEAEPDAGHDDNAAMWRAKHEQPQAESDRKN